jgi:hypothetical protein
MPETQRGDHSPDMGFFLHAPIGAAIWVQIQSAAAWEADKSASKALGISTIIIFPWGLRMKILILCVVGKKLA